MVEREEGGVELEIGKCVVCSDGKETYAYIHMLIIPRLLGCIDLVVVIG